MEMLVVMMSYILPVFPVRNGALKILKKGTQSFFCISWKEASAEGESKLLSVGHVVK